MGGQRRQAGVDHLPEDTAVRLLGGIKGQCCQAGVDRLPEDTADHLLGDMEGPYLQVGADHLPEGMAGRLDQLDKGRLPGGMSMNLRLSGADRLMGNLGICQHLQEVGHQTEGTEDLFPQAGAGHLADGIKNNPLQTEGDKPADTEAHPSLQGHCHLKGSQGHRVVQKLQHLVKKVLCYLWITIKSLQEEGEGHRRHGNDRERPSPCPESILP